jgi:hypothetical protein
MRVDRGFAIVDGNALPAIPFLLLLGPMGLLMVGMAFYAVVWAIRPTESGVSDASMGSANYGGSQGEPKGPIGFDHDDDGGG